MMTAKPRRKATSFESLKPCFLFHSGLKSSPSLAAESGSMNFLPQFSSWYNRHRSEIESVTQDHLGNQMVGCPREAHAQAEIDFPLRCDIQINRRKNLVLLL